MKIFFSEMSEITKKINFWDLNIFGQVDLLTRPARFAQVSVSVSYNENAHIFKHTLGYFYSDKYLLWSRKETFF
jgi:hypothetical protein